MTATAGELEAVENAPRNRAHNLPGLGIQQKAYQ